MQKTSDAADNNNLIRVLANIVVIGISPCSRDVFAPLLNKLVYVLDSLMAGHYIWRRGISF